jgi:ferredoxin--NADP+ reductase
MAKLIETARLTWRRDLNETLALFRFELENGVPDFVAGQFVTLGLPIPQDEGKVLWRAYSIASPPSQKDHLELYIREPLKPFPGKLTSELWKLPIGGTLQHRGITGPFTVEETKPDGTPDTRAVLCVGGGTGIAPFMAYALEMRRRDVPRELVVLHGASYVHELGYDETLRRIAEETKDAPAGSFRLRYVPSVSRPQDESNRGWSGESGRIEALLIPDREGEPSRLERMLGREITPDQFFVHACGYDGTCKAVTAALEPRGFRSRRNKRPDGTFDLKIESYG